jgi:predicted ATPase
VFDDPVAAVGAAAAIQREIGGVQWQHADGVQVRAAVHTGVVHRRDDDVFGTAVNRVARILGVCPPGAVLVSGATSGLLADRAPEGLVVRPVGEVALAGFATPEAVHALTGAGLVAPDSFAEAASSLVGRRGGSLPPIDEELIGRVDELAAVWDGLSRARLVTLVGVGGMGKTRLALEVAAGAVDAFADGVWWVDLSNAPAPETVVPVAMAVVGAREAPGRTALESLCDWFAGRSALVVVDNCEHVLGAAAQLVQALRVAAPEVRVLATSREALGVRGEVLVPVGSLSAGEGVALFAERATSVRPDLDAVAAGAAIERLVTRLDGIPLAIELAAARCRSMTPTEIDGLLGDRFRLLRGGRSGAERHRTLQAAVAWSYEMLEPDERHVFHHLAVFAGGTLIDGVAAVTGLDMFDALDVVDRLVARSLVVATATALGTRYHQLETLRQFAEDRLVEANTIGGVRDRHLGWAQQLAAWIADSDCTPRGVEAFGRFCAEIDNLRVAVAHAIRTNHHHTAHEIVAAVAEVAYARPAFEVVDWVRPIRLDGDWTDAAARCAAWGASFDLLRGLRVDDGPIGGVPDHFLSNAVVAARHVAVQSSGFGRWGEAFEVLANAHVHTVRDRLALDSLWLMAKYFQQLVQLLDDQEFAEVRDRAAAAIGTARALGDDLACSQILWRSSLALLERRPEEAFDLASEAIAIGERLGAAGVVTHATPALHLAAAGRGGASSRSRPEQAAALRGVITRLLEERQPFLAGSSTFPTFGLISNSDPDAALVMVLVWRRVTGVDTTRHLERGGIPAPEDWSEWERRAADVSLTDAVRGIVAALDRVIASEEAG